MPKYFPLVRTKTVVVGDTGAVGGETLRYDLPEIHPVPIDAVSAAAFVNESTPSAVELGVLAILLPANETYPVPVEDVTGTEVYLGSTESHAASEDAVSLVVQTPIEPSLPPVEVVGLTTTVATDVPATIEDVTGTEAVVVSADIEPNSFDVTEIESGIEESSGAAVDPSRIEVELLYLWPNAVESNTGFSNTGNMLDKSDSSFAACSASSSGAVGTGGTQESTSCDFEVSVLDPELDDLTIDLVELSWDIGATTQGIQTSAGECVIDYQYKLSGGSWVTFFAQTAQETSTSSLVITGAIGGDWQKIKDITFRALGQVNSGTGVLSVTTTATWSFTKLRILASKDY